MCSVCAECDNKWVDKVYKQILSFLWHILNSLPSKILIKSPNHVIHLYHLSYLNNNIIFCLFITSAQSLFLEMIALIKCQNYHHQVIVNILKLCKEWFVVFLCAFLSWKWNKTRMESSLGICKVLYIRLRGFNWSIGDRRKKKM